MPASTVAKDIAQKGQTLYGDPCYDSTFGSTKDECERVTPTKNLAKAVLESYQIEVSEDWTVGSNAEDNVCCCPLDILNQDPVSCIKMSLMASLLDNEYWVVHADEYGKARFVKVLPVEEARSTTLPRVQYCTPSLQPADIANLVIVRSADPPPFRKCGKLKINGQEFDWYYVVDGTVSAVRSITSVFPGGSGPEGASSAEAIMFKWSEVNGHTSETTTPTCDNHRFSQYGSVIYPDYERKQIYSDGIVDLFEIEGFEQILFWISDISYNIDDDALAHYSIQFVKSTDMPVHLDIIAGQTYNDTTTDFGTICDIGEGTGTEPSMSYNEPIDDSGDGSSLESCSSVQSSMNSAKKRQAYVSWLEYSVPSFFGYGYAKSTMSFKDYSKWNVIGADKCIDNAFDSVYESTTSLWGNGSLLHRWQGSMYLGTTTINLGPTKPKRSTMDLPQGSVWVESIPLGVVEDQHYAIYSLRAQAPTSATIRQITGYPVAYDSGWYNILHNYMLTYVTNPILSSAVGSLPYGDMSSLNYKPPGYLFGWDDQLYLVDDLWAKVKIARPGIVVQGFGKDVGTLLSNMRMRVKPVYQVDFPAAVAAAGETYNGYVDPFKDLSSANHAYCEEADGETEAEKLQEAMTGQVIDITIPFLFPDYRSVGQYSPNQVSNKDAFVKLSNECYGVAKFLWDYVKQFKDEPNKGFTYVCGPPRSQDQVMRLGDSIDTDAGLRTIKSISYSYNDQSSFTVTVEAGYVSISQAHQGAITKKRTNTFEVRGKVVDQVMGGLYKVHIDNLGVIKAWNIDKYPWDIGDKVNVTLYNHPMEK